MNDSVVFVDFLDINKPHRKKIYRNTNDYNKLANVLNEFQMKLSSTSLEVRTETCCVESEECCVCVRARVYTQVTYIHANAQRWVYLFHSRYFQDVCV